MKITHCKLEKKAQLKRLEYFVLGMTARSAANMLDINPNSAALFYTKIRQVIVHYLEQDSIKEFAGIIEVDESYFGGARKGKKGRGAPGKVAVFGLLKRGGKVYTQVFCNTKAKTLMPVMTRKIAPDSIFTQIVIDHTIH